MRVSRRFTQGLDSPYAGQIFESRVSEIREPDGRVVFRQADVKVPSTWSQVATDILAQKYFRRTGVPGKGGESDAREVFHRLAGCWTDWGRRHGYFKTEEDGAAFHDEICYMLSRQMAAPNSPQWFNTGLHYAYGIEGKGQGHYFVDPVTGQLTASSGAYERPQTSACFIQSIDDDLVNEGGVMDLWVREARIFKYGSGSGTNFSRLRAAGEKLSGGGRSSGLMSFLKVGDRAAGVIKSGGTTRRAAKMVCLDLDHPEIEDFIGWKMVEEQKVAALVAGSRAHRARLARVMDACWVGGTVNAEPASNAALKSALRGAREAGIPDGSLVRALQLAKQGKRHCDFPSLDTDWEGDAYFTVSGQNANNSVRIPNAFFRALETGGKWALKYRTDGAKARDVDARDLWERIGAATWASADPGIQCDTTINEWHTCPAGGRIGASNPCSEYHFIDDTACNLASLNLLAFYDEKNGELRIEDFRHACRLWTMVLEISVLMAQFPSKAIARKSFEYRTIGLGYANLGALLMSMGIPYGSREALAVTGAISAILTGESYAASAEMAGELGPFARYEENKDAMLRVIRNHRRAAQSAPAKEYEGLSVYPMSIDPHSCPSALLTAARGAWDRALAMGVKHGFRNAQATVIAPTGTIGLIMDCDTTGIEPDFALVKFKKLAGGGYFRIINQSVPRALRRLGYTPDEVEAIVGYAVGHGTLKEAPFVSPEKLRARGVSEAEIARMEAAVPSAFSLAFAFAPVKLEDLGLSAEEIAKANDYVYGAMTVEGAPHLKPEHYPVFDCANPCGVNGKRYLPYQAHIDMMAAAQPFVSGAISKTINMPADASIEDVKSAYLDAWKKMVKAISIYRDGSKLSQPLSAYLGASVLAVLDEEGAIPPSKEMPVAEMPAQPPKAEAPRRTGVRRELPKRRFGYTVKATIGGQRVYLRTGEYEDGQLGEIFVDVYKEGAAYRSLMNAFAISISMGLQYGVPLEEYLSKFHLFRFEPNGFVADHDHIKFCSSIIDFIFRDLAMNYLGRTDLVHVRSPGEAALEMQAGAGAGMGAVSAAPALSAAPPEGAGPVDVALTQAEWSNDKLLEAKVARAQGYEGDPCSDCGQFTLVRSGTCLRCVSCGATSGCS